MNPRPTDPLAQLRASLDLSVREAARRSGIARNTIKEVEDGAGRRSSRERYAAYLQAEQRLRGNVSGVTSGDADPEHNGAVQDPTHPAGVPLPTIIHRYAELRAQLTAVQLEVVTDVERDTYVELAEAIPDPQARLEQSIRIAVRYIERMLRNARPGVDQG